MNMTIKLNSPFLFWLLLLPTIMCGQNKANPEYLRNLNIRNIGPGAMSGRITAIAVDPDKPTTIYAGAASGGVWRSKSGGTKWEPIFDSAPVQSIGAIAINPKNPDDIWVGTGEGNPRNSQNFGAGIFRSLDGGKNWSFMGLANTRTIHRIIIHRDNPDIIWVASQGSTYGPTEERGVFKTTDGGKTWRKILYVNDLTGCAELVADPNNPNKLIAAMWEYRRWPWFFKSGGNGSGLYVSHDGGENWERRTDKDGLPEGELGRMGLAIARSNPDVVYALVEAKENALYKSTDGGKKWSKTTTKGMGDRPFYYAEIYVDPKDENTVYSIFTFISKSLDGGKNFDTWAGWTIHPDHHAFWINPNDPRHIINGNDGGLNITYDGGASWRYAENIPVGQFYHVETDNEWPYNVYGGLQDNGSWVGPSAVWKSGGIRNSDWQEVEFGDGFETMPQKDDTRYCFAQSQGGNLSWIDRKTGDSRYIQPVHQDSKVKLRFNWNSALAQDPHTAHGIYFGSQFVHFSTDLGQTWQIISPDLSTNDSSKMHQDISGGLTMDATNAENHCTIIAINPSPVQSGVIWVGTDDGNVQLTRDGGKTWENCSSRLPEAPKNGWIAAIEASPGNAGEAFVALNNYRQNDWNPYLYHTTDFGKSWRRLAFPRNVSGFCLSVVQDPETPDLVFLGTDFGLYFSLDHGNNWTKWPTPTPGKGGGLPSVPVYDMKIQQRDGDLVLGTFGRGIWIMDNLGPLREMARAGAAILDKPFKLFTPQAGIQAEMRSFDGPRFAVDATYEGDNKWPGVRIPIWANFAQIEKEKKAKAEKEKAEKEAREKDKEKDKDKKDKPAMDKDKATAGKSGGPAAAGKDAKKEKATVMVFNAKGDTLRRWKANVDSMFSAAFWNMDTRGVRFPSKNEPDKEQLEPGGGPKVLPGDYKVVVTYQGYRDSTMVKVMADPRLKFNAAELEAQNAAYRDMFATVERATKAYDRLKEAEKTLKLIDDAFSNVPDSVKKDLGKLSKPIRDSISVLKERFFSHKEDTKGIQPGHEGLNSKYWRARSYIGGSNGAPNAAAQTAIMLAKQDTEDVLNKINKLFDGPWKEYRTKVEAIKYSLFKDWERL